MFFLERSKNGWKLVYRWRALVISRGPAALLLAACPRSSCTLASRSYTEALRISNSHRLYFNNFPASFCPNTCNCGVGSGLGRLWRRRDVLGSAVSPHGAFTSPLKSRSPSVPPSPHLPSGDGSSQPHTGCCDDHSISTFRSTRKAAQRSEKHQ